MILNVIQQLATELQLLYNIPYERSRNEWMGNFNCYWNYLRNS